MIAVLAALSVMSAVSFGQQTTMANTFKWYRGNTHTHTLNSDGDSTPEVVVKWYRDNGYNFLFITDHEFITPVQPLNNEFGKEGEFLVLPGQEVTDRLNNKPYHVNGLGVDRVTMPKRGRTVIDNLQQNIDAIRSIGGIPQINHPNFGWALTSNDIRAVKNVMLMEVYNGHPLVNNLGGGGSPGAEEIWDALLSGGKLIYGIADDDSHFFKRLGDRSAPTPGQAWIVIRSRGLTGPAILAALESGNFYASTGVELVDYIVNPAHITIHIREEKSSKYSVHFIGRGGRVLKTVISNPATYKIRGDEGYVRAKIVESNGRLAWTQPVIIAKK